MENLEKRSSILTGVVFEALDVDALEAFWLEATRGETDGLQLTFVPAEAPKTVKNRLHLDLAGGPDWPAEVQRLEALGARKTDIGQGDVPWDVLADPEGNEFCVLRPGHRSVRHESGLVQICLDVAEDDWAAQHAFWRAESGWDAYPFHPLMDCLRRTEDSRVALITGPPAAPKAGRNRVRLVLTGGDREPGTFVDPGDNEFEVA
ncbi:VOC family protein [Actinospica robiniae]|uniref:VOC family protein n=1 Tax=Actinospica robiniae TaxID=304901 RepID=UPI000412EE26|nr:VOC family protein [Actinospica robiniae]